MKVPQAVRGGSGTMSLVVRHEPIHIKVMRYLRVSFLAFAVSGCGNVDKEAGLTGSNPVVSVAYETGAYDPPTNIRLSIADGGKVNLSAESEFAGTVARERQVDPASFDRLAKALRALRVPPGKGDSVRCVEPIHRHASRVRLVWAYRDGREGSLSSDVCRDDASAGFNDAIQSFKQELYDQRWLDGLPRLYATALHP